MLHLIQAAVVSPNTVLPEVAVPVERTQIVKRLWRGAAVDGTEFGFELGAPLKHGDTVFETLAARYVLRQTAEVLLEISLEIASSAAAGIGWSIGNLHLELQAESTRLLALDEPAVRRLLERLKVPFTQTTAVFRPGRFARGNHTASSHELGPSHRH